MLTHMTVMAIPYEEHGALEAAPATRFARSGGAAMDADRTVKVQELRELVARERYEVDAQATAAAIVERLLAARAAREPRPE